MAERRLVLALNFTRNCGETSQRHGQSNAFIGPKDFVHPAASFPTRHRA
jgi:hypothetical protein